ncbi:MAG TPA: hypothetical protein QGF58_18095 [Myxococcota bacterium]|nr:hypothetical protein [Myxococcota bacterium]
MLALILVGCPPKVPAPTGPVALDDRPVLLGWRLVPGDVHRYALTTQWGVGVEEVLRVERWDYLVRSVDEEGVATLEGSLVGLGAEVRRQGQPYDVGLEVARGAEKERLGTVTLSLARDGRLVAIEGLDWADALPHRLLALRLSAEEIRRGDVWPDPVLARPYASLMPVSLDVTVEGYSTFEGLYQVGERVLARLSTRGAVKPAELGAPEVWLSGETWWDPLNGLVDSRTLSASLGNVRGEPGTLSLGIERVEVRPAQ